jgi:rod shape determining protein RodA
MALIQTVKNKSFDWVTLTVYFSLVAIGWAMLYSTTYNPDQPFAFMSISTIIGSQTAWLIISMLAFISVLTLDWKFWNTLSFPLYGISVMLLILVLIFGKEINGSKSWFSFGVLSFQPSECAKLGTALALSGYLSFLKTNIADRRTLITSFGIMIAPALLILLQPDPGSALVFLSFFILLYRKGLSPLVFILGFSFGGAFIFSLIFSPVIVTSIILCTVASVFLFYYFDSTRGLFGTVLLIATEVFLYLQGEVSALIICPLAVALVFGVLHFLKKNFRLIVLSLPIAAIFIAFSFGSSYVFEKALKPHQQDRINVWLRPEKCDPRGSLYNIIQSKLAIGSGGLAGKGYLKGEMTKLNYVPEQTTDFIFTSVGEEQGFIGSVGVILLYTILLLRCITIAERAKLEFIRNYAYCVLGIILVHFTINIGMTLGIMPVIGIPLPFLSKGGSSLLAFSVMIGILVKMDMARFRAN